MMKMLLLRLDREQPQLQQQQQIQLQLQRGVEGDPEFIGLSSSVLFFFQFSFILLLVTVTQLFCGGFFILVRNFRAIFEMFFSFLPETFRSERYRYIEITIDGMFFCSPCRLIDYLIG